MAGQTYVGDIYRVFNKTTNEWDFHLFATRADAVITAGTDLNFLSNTELSFLQGIMGGGSGGGVLNKIRLGKTGPSTIDTSDDSALTLGNNVIITGSLTVQGTTTTIHTQDIAVTDKDIILAKDNTTAAGASGGGLKLKVGSDVYKTFTWDDSIGEGGNGSWVSNTNAGVGIGFSYYIGSSKVLSGDTLGTSVTKSSLTKLGLSTAGFVITDVNGNLTVKATLSSTDIPNLTSQKITAITGYTEATTYTQLAESDSLNAALGKIQKGLNVVKSTVTKETVPTAADYNRKELIDDLFWIDKGSTVVEPSIGLYTLRLKVLGNYGSSYIVSNEIKTWRESFRPNFSVNFSYPVALFSTNFGFLTITFTGYSDLYDIRHNDFLLSALDFAGNIIPINAVIPDAVISGTHITEGALVEMTQQGEGLDIVVSVSDQDLLIPGGKLIYLNNLFLCPGIYLEATIGS